MRRRKKLPVCCEALREAVVKKRQAGEIKFVDAAFIRLVASRRPDEVKEVVEDVVATAALTEVEFTAPDPDDLNAWIDAILRFFDEMMERLPELLELCSKF